jgi:hypothetical protein
VKQKSEPEQELCCSVVQDFTAAWVFTGLYPLLMHADAIPVTQTT